MAFQNIEINNFRGIDKLIIDNLSRINVFVGKNNVGKTSILEAIFLLSNVDDIDSVIEINNNRELNDIEDDKKHIDTLRSDLKLLFRNLNTRTAIKLSGETIESRIRYLLIKAIDDKMYNELSHDNLSNSNKQNQTSPNIGGILYEYGENFKIDNPKFKTYEEHNAKIKFEYAKKVYETSSKGLMSNFEAIYLVHSSIYYDISEFEELIINNKKKKIIDALNKIDKRVTDFACANDRLYVNVGLATMLPINVLGDGVIRIAHILANLIDSANGILLIDEVDTGLHYTALSTLWECVIEMANEYNVQIFVTTHSDECVEKLATVMQKNENAQKQNWSLYRIAQTDDKTIAIHYAPDIYETSIKMDLEYR